MHTEKDIGKKLDRKRPEEDGEDESEYFKFLGVNTVQFLPNRMKPILKKIGKVGNNIFLITTANNAYFTESEKTILCNLLIELVNFF